MTFIHIMSIDFSDIYSIFQVETDRKYEIEAVIVRVMKTKLKLQHSELISEVVYYTL